MQRTAWSCLVELRERHHRLDRWVSLLVDQAEKTPTKPAV